MDYKRNLFIQCVFLGSKNTQMIFEKQAEVGMVLKIGIPVVIHHKPLFYGFITGMQICFEKVDLSPDFQCIWDFREIYKVKKQFPEVITQEYCLHFQSTMPGWKYVKGVLLPQD